TENIEPQRAFNDNLNFVEAEAAVSFLPHDHAHVRMNGSVDLLAGLIEVAWRRYDAESFLAWQFDGVIDRIAEINRAANGAGKKIVALLRHAARLGVVGKQ